MSGKDPIQLDMVSDLVCPWCWIGLRHLLFALYQIPDRKYSLTFRSFFLDPSVPAQGMEYEDYMRRKFPDAAKRAQGIAMLEEAGRSVGIEFNFKKITRRPHTLDAHRLLLWAQGQGLGLQVKEMLFAAYFHHGHDIGDRAVLVKVAEAAGMDGKLVGELLATDRDVDRVMEEVQVFQKMGITGVPTFIVNARAGTSGALPPDDLKKFILDHAD